VSAGRRQPSDAVAIVPRLSQPEAVCIASALERLARSYEQSAAALTAGMNGSAVIGALVERDLDAARRVRDLAARIEKLRVLMTRSRG